MLLLQQPEKFNLWGVLKEYKLRDSRRNVRKITKQYGILYQVRRLRKGTDINQYRIIT